MTNAERRLALAKARRRALEYAEHVDDSVASGANREPYMQLANMWANVANAMKVGQSLEADGVIDEGVVHTEYGTITR